MRRLPARHWNFQVSIERTLGSGGVGEILEPARTHRARIQQETKTVRDDSGSETVSTTQVQVPAEVEPVPVGSIVELPAIFGGARTRVIVSAPRFFGGGSPQVAYYSLDCE